MLQQGRVRLEIDTTIVTDQTKCWRSIQEAVLALVPGSRGRRTECTAMCITTANVKHDADNKIDHYQVDRYSKGGAIFRSIDTTTFADNNMAVHSMAALSSEMSLKCRSTRRPLTTSITTNATYGKREGQIRSTLPSPSLH